MSDNVISIFSKFSDTKGSSIENSSQEIKLEPYRAALVERPGRRVLGIRFHYNDGSVEQINYSYRRFDMSVSPERLGISFATGVVLMRGKNLRSFLDDLQDERVRLFQYFDPAKHLPPKEGEPIIHSIDWKPNEEFQGTRTDQSA